MTYVEQVVQWLRDRLARDPPLADPRELNTALRVLAIWRSRAIGDAYVRQYGAKVMQGPFAGMDYATSATEGALTARLLGTYESELHPYLAKFAANPPDCVIDVGCAEGYYAVGLARMMPQVRVHAFDIQEKARRACAEMAAKNGVGDRVIIGERFEPTHDIVRLDPQPKTLPLPDFLKGAGHLDQLLAVWEFRLQATPWLVMTPKA